MSVLESDAALNAFKSNSAPKAPIAFSSAAY